MILEIEVILYNFQKIEKSISNPADINLFFIEEPEAHTHPQMQYIFIKNIKKLLSTAQVKKGLNTLQTIISTHSSHITSESSFDDIKYFRKNGNSIIAKNLSSLKDSYIKDGETGEKYFKFLKQYLTLHRSELFFADKAILIEGDTERILLPAMMKKLDQEDISENTTPLLSQNISIIETGAHSHVFEKFIDFIGIKSLIITDIDSDGKWQETNDDGETKDKKGACPVESEYTLGTSNNAIKFFLSEMNWADIKKGDLEKRKISKKENSEGKPEWVQDPNGHVLICYQTKESQYHARSFEDSFFYINKDFITNEDQPLASLTNKWVEEFRNDKIKVYECAEKSVNSKPTLAMEILLNSNEIEVDGKESVQYSNWKTPQYIKEGLEWLKQ
jgi:predicted ATP-dependent endonuclease of OLD family